ncbi:uncharacterized protein [Phaseolus vulgaris]|uniref:uncharacterized protein n=1 Tax=Phaseolus vulgaris TaxID=3885 RepID=UPI0035CA2AA3
MVGLDSSAQIWNRLLTYYASHTRPMAKKLCLLLKTPKNERSISTYVYDIKKIVDSLAVVGSPVSTANHFDAILDGLSPDFDGFITSIRSHSDPYTVDDLEALLLAQEERFDKHKLAQDPLLQVNTISTPWLVKNQNRKKFSTYTPQGGRSYTAPTRPSARPSSYQPSSWYSVKQFCQICHKSGHTAHACWHRYDPPPTTSFNSNVSQHTQNFDNDSAPSILGAPSTIEDPLWYPDTGATHHVTKDSKIFTHKQPYHTGFSCNVAYSSTTLFCETCIHGKFYQLPFHNSVSQYTAPLQLVFIDIWGVAPVCASNGARYYISFLDAHTKYTWHVIFHEELFPYDIPGYKFHPFVHDNIASDCLNQAITVIHSFAINSSIVSQLSPDSTVPTNPNPSTALVPTSSTDPGTVNTHRMTTRSKTGIFKPKTFHTHSVLLSPVPTFVAKALSSPPRFQAMTDEYTALLNNHTWSLTSLLEGAKVVGCKWLFKNKYHADGSFHRHKARLVAKGFSQTKGCDYNDTYSLVVKPSTIRLVLSHAVSANWPIH